MHSTVLINQVVMETIFLFFFLSDFVREPDKCLVSHKVCRMRMHTASLKSYVWDPSCGCSLLTA